MIVKPEEWISKPGDNGIGLLKVLMVEGEADFPILIETYNVFPEEVKIRLCRVISQERRK